MASFFLLHIQGWETHCPFQRVVSLIAGGEPLYTVALKDTFVQAPMSCLALETNVGEKVSYVVGDTEFSATVQSMELQHWCAPRLMVTLLSSISEAEEALVY